MLRKVLVIFLVTAVILLTPIVSLAESANAGTGNTAAGQNAGESQPVTPPLQGSGQCQQILQKDQLQTREGWQQLQDNLEQYKLQYRQETRTEAREEIMNMFRVAFQLRKEQGELDEAENMLRNMLSLNSRETAAYQELGSIFRSRGETAPKVFLNGNEIKPDTPPVIKEGRTLVPVRAITEGMGATVQWSEQEQTVLISKGETHIHLRVNNRIALVNGSEFNIDVPAEINSSRVFVPLRFIMQVMNAGVDWYPEGQVIAMNENE